jgi:hypothetical protein
MCFASVHSAEGMLGDPERVAGAVMLGNGGERIAEVLFDLCCQLGRARHKVATFGKHVEHHGLDGVMWCVAHGATLENCCDTLLS